MPDENKLVLSNVHFTAVCSKQTFSGGSKGADEVERLGGAVSRAKRIFCERRLHVEVDGQLSVGFYPASPIRSFFIDVAAAGAVEFLELAEIALRIVGANESLTSDERVTFLKILPLIVFDRSSDRTGESIAYSFPLKCFYFRAWRGQTLIPSVKVYDSRAEHLAAMGSLNVVAFVN